MRRRPGLLLALSLLALLLVLSLLWAMVLEERRSRRLSLQFELYRASAALAEAWLDNPSGLFVGGPVLGFGVYEADGSALIAEGTAPPRLEPGLRATGLPEPGPAGDSYRLLRPLPGRGGMDRGGVPRNGPPQGPAYGMMGGGGMGGMGRFGASPLDLALAGPRVMWLEYSQNAGSLGESLLFAGGLVLSLVLIAIYLLVLVLLRRNGELRERETRNRELAELGQAARTLVHEIKNPLGVIGIQAATLRRRDGEESATGRAAAVIDGEVRRLARMADRIRDFLKAGPGDARELDLVSFLGSFAARHQGPEGEATLELELPEPSSGPALVRVDPDRLSLALDNLVSNAREADPSASPSLGLALRGGSWRLIVADRGGGVDPESQERLFEPFFTTKEKGSGIGLALARSVARGAGGELEYAPRPGGGSLFILSLPSPRGR